MNYNRNIINKYHKKSILFGMLFFIFFIGITSAFANVKVEGDRISVDAKGIALGEIVKEIKNSTGIEFELSKTLMEKKISVGFKELSLPEGLKKIIDPLNYAVVYDPGGMISKVIIIDTNEDSKMTAYAKKVDESFPDSQDVSTSKVEPDNDVSSAENASGSDNNKVSAKPPFPEISLPEKAHGEQAIQALADKLPEVAAWYGTTPQQFTTMLRQDLTAWIDTEGRLFFIEEFPEEVAMDESSTPEAAPFSYDQTFKLHSRSGSNRVIFLDFDGHTTTGRWWNSSYGDPIISPAYSMDGDRTSFSNTELDRIQNAWQLVAEDFAPFDVDVTTEDPGQDAITRSSSSDDRYGTRVVMTVDDFAGCGCGGFAYVGIFDYVGDSGKPAFVFNVSLKGMTEAISHEVGHNLGLWHDGVTGGASYYTGHGSGATGWAPIMGVGYYRELVQWSKGEYSNANQTQDDIQVIQNNGALLMADDHGNDQANASALNETTDGVTVTLSGSGFIERRTDIDFFKFTSGNGDISITIDPAPFSPNLDILAELYDSNGILIATSNPVDGLSASINETALPAGEYFISIDGIGKGDPLGTGYTDYASLGQYSISGSIPEPGSVVPVTWVDTVGVTVSGNSITKNASNGWGNGGAASSESITGDGGVEFTATQTNTHRMCGLSRTNPDADYKSIEYAIFLLSNGQIRVFESGVNKGSFGTYQIGDTFMVERVGSTIVYKQNDVIFYTSVTSTDSALLVDSTIYNNGGKVSDAKFIGITPGSPGAIADLGAADGNNEVTLNWTAPADNFSPITEYEVQYGTVSGGNFDTIFTDDAVPGATITGLTNGVEYQFRVVATNAIGTGSASNVAKAIPVTFVNFTWVDTVGVTVNGNSITKNASNGWGNGGAASSESITGDGGVEFTATQTNTHRMCGLSRTNPDADYKSIEYAIFLLSNGQIRVFESGVNKGSFGTYQIGDSFRVERVGSTIVYKKNDVIFYTSLTPAGSVLLVDCSIYSNGGEISDVNLIGIAGPNVNLPPVLNPISDISVNEGDTVTLNPTATDPDGDALTYTYSGWMTSASYTTNYNDAGVHTVTVSVSDGTLTDSQDVTVTVANTNRPPVLYPISDITVNEGDTVTFTPTVTDPDGGTLWLTYSGWMTSGSYTTNYTDAGVHTVTVTLSDGSLTDSQDVTVTVADANLPNDTTAPTNGSISINGGAAITDSVYVTLELSATDDVGVTSRYITTSKKPKPPSPKALSGWISVTPTTNYSGIVNYGDGNIKVDGDFTVYVFYKDAAGNVSAEYSDTITLITNLAPVLDPIADISVNEGNTVTLNPTATDPDGDALTYTYSGWMTSASYTTGYNDAGAHTVTVTVSDGKLTDSQVVTITVNDVTGLIPVTWVDTVGVTVNGNSITKNASNGWGNGGAASLESFTGDSGVEFTATQTNTYRMCGLSRTNPDADYKSIEYAIFLLSNGQIRVFESGVNKGSFGTYQIGDMFMVERVGSTIVYKKNNVIFYTSVTPTDSALLVDSTIYNNGGKVSDAKFIGITPGSPGAIADLGAADGNNEVTLNWTAPADNFSPITEYEVQYGTVSGGNFDTIFTDDAVPGATITGLTNGVEYQFRVVATNAIGTGSASNVAKAIPVTFVNFTWVDTVGVTVNGNSITKNASNGWGNGGAASSESITGDGGVEFTATQTNTHRMCGLSRTNPDADYKSIEYAIFLLSNGQIRVFESGVNKGSFGTYQIGDTFMVERVGSTIVYKKNDVIFYTSLTPAGSVLLVDCSIYSNGGEISDVNLIDLAGIGGSASDTTPPSTPDNLQATAISASQIDLSWDASTDDVGVTGYMIYRDGTQIDTTASSTYQDTGLSASTSYMYTVSAIDGAGNESYQSLSASATTGF